MARDVLLPIKVGVGGLNFRDQPAEVDTTELVDGMNWRLDERGALVKRLGYANYTATQLAAAPLELATYLPAAATAQLIAYLSDGSVVRSPEDGTYTTIRTGLSATARPSFAQYQDQLFMGNGVDPIGVWDGTTWTTIAGAIRGSLLAVWRNRLWVAGDPAHPRRVYWSALGAPTDFATYPNNWVEFPGPTVVTALAPSPIVGAGGDTDSLIVFKERSTHRITSDADNTGGVTTGGANILVDAGVGCVAPRTVRPVRGRLYLLARDGVYSTDGRDPLRLESTKLGSFFVDGVAPNLASQMTATEYQGNYLLAVTLANQTRNTVVFEVYTSFPRDGQGRLPILAMDIPAAAFARFPNVQGDRLYFADSGLTSSLYLRRFSTGSADVTGASTTRTITATARTGALNFGSTTYKRVRRIRVDGRGTILVGVQNDFRSGVGETHTFSMPMNTPAWGAGTFGQWGDETWGPVGKSTDDVQWYDKRGCYFTLIFTENSNVAGIADTRLGQPGPIRGGAAIYAVELKITPLEC